MQHIIEGFLSFQKEIFPQRKELFRSLASSQNPKALFISCSDSRLVPELVTQPWLEDELVVFAAPDNPLTRQPPTLEALANAPWILRERGSGTREVLDHLLLAYLPHFQLVMELGNSEAIKHAVRHGIGISCLSRRVVAEQLASGALVELPVPLPPLRRTLYLIRHRQKHISNALQRFLSYCAL